MVIGYFIFTVQQRTVEKFDIMNDQLAQLDSSLKVKHGMDSAHTPLILQQNHSLFVGAEQTDSMKLICGIDIKTAGPKSFQYTLDFLNDWKKFKTIKGIAICTSTREDNYQMKDAHSDKNIPAHTYIDIPNNLLIEISNQDLTSSIARVKKFIGNEKALTPVMFYK
jgi:hypothetical protein